MSDETAREGLALVTNTEKSAPKRKKRKRETKGKARPKRVLPTERISSAKQLDILRAFAIASGPTGRVVSNKEVGEIVKMAEGTIYLTNPFFTDIGFLQRADAGFIPSGEVQAFQRAYEWNPQTASQRLAPAIEDSWFAEAILPKASFQPIDLEQALTDLAEVCSAGPEYRSQLRMLIDLLEATGLLQRDGNSLRKSAGGGNVSAPTEKHAVGHPTGDGRESQSKSALSTTFSQPTEGTINFHVTVRVDMKEFAGWAPERINAFFGGIAQVLAAKADVEKNAK